MMYSSLVFLLVLLGHSPHLLVAGEDQESSTSSSSSVRSSMRGPKGGPKKTLYYDHHGGGSKTASEEKGVKCKGHWDGAKHAGCKSCEGGIKAEFTCGSKATDIMEYIATGIHQQASDTILSTPSEIMEDITSTIVPEDMLNVMMEFDAYNDGNEDETMAFDDEMMVEGFSKSFKFGGFMKANWSCTVTYEMKDGKFHKKTECGFKGAKGMGKAPKDEDDDEDEMFVAVEM